MFIIASKKIKYVLISLVMEFNHFNENLTSLNKQIEKHTKKNGKTSWVVYWIRMASKEVMMWLLGHQRITLVKRFWKCDLVGKKCILVGTNLSLRVGFISSSLLPIDPDVELVALSSAPGLWSDTMLPPIMD